jgi:type II secretion system protein G
MKIVPFLSGCLVLAMGAIPGAWAQDADEKKAGEAALAFARAMVKADGDAVKKLVRKDHAAKADDLLKELGKGDDVDPAKLKVLDVRTRTVVTIEGPDGQRIQLGVVKENGEWKVDLQQMLELMGERVEEARKNRADSDVETIITQLQFYEVRNGNFPSTKQGLKALVEKPEGDPQPRRWSQLMPEVPKDPWGNLYHYRYPTTKQSKDGFDLFSAGPDGKPGTADDIGNW